VESSLKKENIRTLKMDINSLILLTLESERMLVSMDIPSRS